MLRSPFHTRLHIAGLAALAFAVAFPAAAQNWAVDRQIHIGGEGGWDYLTVDPSTHRLFIPRSTHTLVVDAASGKTLGDIPGQKRNHGVALVPSVNRGFITDGGGEGALVVFDLKTYKVLGTLKAMPDADGIIYDKGTDKVLFVSGDGESLTIVSPNIDPNGKLDEPIKLGGSPEFLAADGSGKVYVNIMNKNEVQAVDIKARKVVATWPVAPGGAPVGMSIDPGSHHIFIGCRRPQLLVEMSTTDGKVLSSVPIGAGVDATGFLDGQVFASTGDGNLTVAGEKNGKLEVSETVKTGQGARTLGVDPVAKKIYLPTSEFEAPTAPGTRPKAKPGTFLVIEVGRK